MCIYQRWKVLRVEPATHVTAGEGKISIVSQSPQDVSRAGSILIVYLYNPALIAHGKQQIRIIRRVYNGIAVSPIGQSHQMTIQVEMIECRPKPGRVPVLVEI